MLTKPKYCPSPFVLFKNSSTGEDECVCVRPRNSNLEEEGSTCELQESNCPEEECQNGGECVQLGMKAFCICPSDFVGVYCEQHKNENKIINNSLIENNNFSSSKILPLIPANKEECKIKGKNCLNGGICTFSNLEKNESFCKCTEKFTGNNFYILSKEWRREEGDSACGSGKSQDIQNFRMRTFFLIKTFESINLRLTF
uniref:EGF-like domain-containing protein n=1 Tax=Meloidogyne incognita TaxID=6306 RepID=A0A914KFV7_MELIC